MIKNYSFETGAVPPGYTPEFEVSLFNEVKHSFLQAPTSKWQSFFVLNRKKNRVAAQIHFHVSEQTAQSPFRAPFGSIEFVGTLSPQVIYEFLLFIETYLKKQGASNILIKNYPQAYAENQATILQTLLFNLGYRCSMSEIGSVLSVKRKSLYDLCHRSARRRLDKAKNFGLVARPIPLSDLAEVYNFIYQCRAEKRYPISMTLTDLRETVNIFPDRYLLFGVFDNNQLVAASICIRVKEKVLYDFYHDHAAAYDGLSPVVLLVNTIYDYCQDENIKLLDLGTSALNGVPNFPLLHFKKMLGCKPTMKLTFEKRLGV